MSYETMKKACEMSIKLQGIEPAHKDLIELNMAIRSGRPSILTHLTDYCEKRWGKIADAKLKLIQKKILNKKH